jgi:hypothetical protein
MMCNNNIYRHLPTYKDLFNHLEKGCNFRKVKGKTTWNCDRNLTMTEEFCKTHGLNFPTIQDELNLRDAYCDCEVLLNAMDRIDGNKVLERIMN